MLPSINQTSKLVLDITHACAEQTAGVTQVNTLMLQMTQITQQNASGSEQLAATAEEMSGQAEVLRNLIAFFRLQSEFGLK